MSVYKSIIILHSYFTNLSLLYKHILSVDSGAVHEWDEILAVTEVLKDDSCRKAEAVQNYARIVLPHTRGPGRDEIEVRTWILFDSDSIYIKIILTISHEVKYRPV